MSIAWFIVITVVVVGLQIFIYSKWSLSGVHYRRSFSDRIVFEGDKIDMIDEISNKKLLPLPWLRLESRLHKNLKFDKHEDNLAGELEMHRALFSFMPYQKITRKQHFTCTKRGFYQFSDVHLTSGDPFGFSDEKKSIKAPGQITVYPRLLNIDELPLPSQSWLGEVIVRRWIMEDPFLAAGVREYASGDSLNTINWQATARTNQLQVTKHDFSADHNVMIYLNFNQTGDIWRPIVDKALIEKSLSYAATIASHIISKGVNVGFGCNTYIGQKTRDTIRIEPESSKQQLNYLLTTMAKVEVDANMSVVSFLQEDLERELTGQDILLITASVTAEMKEAIALLEAQGNLVEILLLDSERIQEYKFARGGVE